MVTVGISFPSRLKLSADTNSGGASEGGRKCAKALGAVRGKEISEGLWSPSSVFIARDEIEAGRVLFSVEKVYVCQLNDKY